MGEDPKASAPTVPETDDERASMPMGQVGRFTIERLLGSGGMGIVFVALDPVLDRRVALKLIRGAGDRAEERLLREAQALAKLKHANVVTVHEAGSAEGSVFIAMELVDGTNLRTWLETPRTWREVLAVFVAAGRGLAAAHEAGLVHRDFKPENVFVDRAGAVKVGDFGLVGVIGDEALEKDGSIMGTPGYMAPEQVSGELVDARADQFAFCKSLAEALHGRAKPAWLAQAIDRGQAKSPADRWPSMPVLLDTLDRTPRKRRTIALAIGGAVLIAGAATVGAFATRGDPAMSCGEDEFETVWNGDVRATMTAQFGKVRASGPVTAERTAAGLDAFATEWKTARVAACGMKGKILDLRLHCLDRVANSARVLIGTLVQADGKLVDHAVDRVAGLPAPDACTADELVDAIPVPSDPRVAVIEQLLDEARVADDTEKRKAGHAAAVRALAIAVDLGHPMLRAEARALAAGLGDDLDPAAEQREYEEALADATRANDHHLQAAITMRLLENAIQVGNKTAMETLLPIARAATANTTEAVQKKNFALYESQVLIQVGRYDDALKACDRLSALEPEPHVLAADCRCSATSDGNRLPEAKLRCQEALVASEKFYGKGTASTYTELANVAIVLRKLGENAAALEYRQRSLPLAIATYGAESRRVAQERYGLALILADLGRHADAKRELETALELFSRGQTKPTKDMALVHLQLAAARGDLGDLAGAADESDLAIQTLDSVLGPSHPNLAIALLNQGEANLTAKRPAVALVSFTRGAELSEKVYGPKHLVFGAHLIDRARALFDLGRTKEALPFAERGASIVQADNSDADYLALSHATLGKVQLALGDRTHGRAELTIARDAFRAIGATAKANLDEVERLLGP